MKNALSYEEYGEIAQKVDAMLRSLGIDPDGDRKNDPRADLILALVADMAPGGKRLGWVSISNCLFGVITNDDAPRQLRLSAIVLLLHLFETDPVASAPMQQNGYHAEECREAIALAGYYMTRPKGHMSKTYVASMEQVFGEHIRLKVDHPSITHMHIELRLQAKPSANTLALYDFGDYVASTTCRTPEEARAALLSWKAAGKIREAAFDHFLPRVDGLFH